MRFIKNKVLGIISGLILCHAAMAHPAPIPNYHIENLCFGDSTTFINTTINGINYNWTIYENNSFGWIPIYASSETNIKFLFPYIGIFKVQLDADNGHFTTITRTLHVDDKPVAIFDYTYCQSMFTNLSSCWTSCKWDFGDGKTSIEKSPTHFFDSIGTYGVKLTVFRGNESDSALYDINVDFINILTGKFSYIITKDSVKFIAADTNALGPFTEYHWAFGDGTTANLYKLGGGNKVWHTFKDKDTTYQVFLLVRETCMSAYSQSALFLEGPPVSIIGTDIFPNPVTGDILHITSEKQTQISEIKIVDCLGRRLYPLQISEHPKSIDLNIANLPPSVYFVEVHLPYDVIVIKKIVKQ